MLENVTKGQVLKYALLPQMLPRMQDFAKTGFRNLAYFMALVYQAVGLIPANHLYLQRKAYGAFGIRDVISAAAENLSFSTKHIDQIIIFFALIAGIVILFIQFLLLMIAFAVGPASAAEMPSNYLDFVKTASPDEDLALRLLDSVFGVSGGGSSSFFGSIEPTETLFHTALHQLFQFYSTGLLVVAAIIIAYYVFAVLAETAQTGTPFGKRFNHVWAPIRLVVAIGLLIPIGSGLNSGQWIALYSAKFGSGFATNGWIKFNETIREEYIPSEELVAKNQVPEMKDLAAFMMIAHACKEAYTLVDAGGKKIGPDIEAYILNHSEENGAAKVLEVQTPWTRPELFKDGNIYIRFGYEDAEYAQSTNNIYPYCGDLVIQNVSVNERDESKPGGGAISGGQVVAWRYYTLVLRMWETSGTSYKAMQENAKKMMEKELKQPAPADFDKPPESLKNDILTEAKKHIDDGIDLAVNDLQEEFNNEQEFMKYGWGGAGIWYNQIASINGRLTNAVMAKPQLKDFPDPMKFVCKENNEQNRKTDPHDCYKLRQSKGKDVKAVLVSDKEIAKALSEVYDFWHKTEEQSRGNIFIASVNAILGTQGLFDMCANANIHPLAQLSSVGKGLVEAAIRNLGYALGTGAAGILAPFFGPALSAASGFLSTIAGAGILIGFILYYIVPFLPFLYFLFAVGGWVKGLFEAMVGIPLWALGHLRIDGQGLPGDGGLNGYFLIFEIFIRPILIVFGLLASVLVFGAMVKVLNDIFSLVVSNLSGYSGEGACDTSVTSTGDQPPTGSIEYFRGPVDEFFFTIMYAILVYMIGMSSFKLIDLIPNNILRWMGAGVPTFNDQSGEPAEGLLSKIAIGGGALSGQLSGIGKGFGDAAKQGAGAVATAVTK